MTPWTVAYQASPSMGFSRQEYWSGLLFPSPGDLPNSGIKPGSPTLEADALNSEPPGKLIKKDRIHIHILLRAKSLQSCPILCLPQVPTRLLHPWDFPGKSAGVGCHCLLRLTPSVQFISVQSLSRVRLCDPMNRSTRGLPVHHHLPEFTQTHVHQVRDAI